MTKKNQEEPKEELKEEKPIEKPIEEPIEKPIEEPKESPLKQELKQESEQDEKLNALLVKIEQLERKDLENQEKLKMLYEVADKGRVFNYENQRSEKKPIKIKLGIFQDGYIIGWRTIKDELVKHPTTGLTVGEVQEYELMVLGKDNEIRKFVVSGYPAFSNARYNERVECEVRGKREDYNGNITYDIQLPEGKVVPIDSKFIN